MDHKGHIYEGTEENPVKPEDAARLDGYLKARAEADKHKSELARIREFAAAKAKEESGGD